MAGKRRYSEDERANALAALAANGGNIKRTATQLGIPEKTVSNWAKGISHPEAAKDGEQKKGSMADAIEQVAWKLVEAMPDKIQNATLSQTATSLGIAIDKMRLLREQPTEIKRHNFDNLSDDELDREIARIEEEARRLAGGEASPRAEPPVEAVPGTTATGVSE